MVMTGIVADQYPDFHLGAATTSSLFFLPVINLILRRGKKWKSEGEEERENALGGGRLPTPCRSPIFSLLINN
jgi:hypothetical protein